MAAFEEAFYPLNWASVFLWSGHWCAVLQSTPFKLDFDLKQLFWDYLLNGVTAVGGTVFIFPILCSLWHLNLILLVYTVEVSQNLTYLYS